MTALNREGEHSKILNSPDYKPWQDFVAYLLYEQVECLLNISRANLASERHWMKQTKLSALAKC
jgi:hypothetical protein